MLQNQVYKMEQYSTKITMMQKLPAILIIIFLLIQGIWIGYKLIVENATEFPNLILPFGLVSIFAALLKWNREPCSINRQKGGT
jgi:hypothetical protein